MQSEAEAPVAGPRDVEAAGVEVIGAEVSYGAVQALGGVTLRVAPGEIVAVAGPSGCGKSTLLELVCGLVAPDAGSVRSAAAALMPQRDALLPWLSALDNAALALRVAGVSRAAARAAAHEHFAAFGLEGFERARPAALSGGMRQRVAFLRTLLAGRPVLCLDEPFGALDALTRLQMQRWLEGALAREPRTVLLVTHDVEEAVLLADRVVLLSPRPGRIVETLEVGLPRPRARDDRAVVELRERALRVLGADEGGVARSDEAGSAGPENGAVRESDKAGSAGSENGPLRESRS
jgi:ABC-type nitrate/sulfonate/bicarbonate transport system ATPase subunit